MEKVSGRVDNFTVKTSKNGTSFAVMEVDGVKGSVWDNIAGLGVGAMIEADIQKKGDYTNFKNVKITDGGSVVPPMGNGKANYGRGAKVGMACNLAAEFARTVYFGKYLAPEEREKNFDEYYALLINHWERHNEVIKELAPKMEDE